MGIIEQENEWFYHRVDEVNPKTKMPEISYIVRDEYGKRVAAMDLVFCGGEYVISNLYVIEDERRKGLGTTLIEKAVKFANDLHCPIAVEYLPNYPFVKLCLKCGFAITAIVENWKIVQYKLTHK